MELYLDYKSLSLIGETSLHEKDGSSDFYSYSCELGTNLPSFKYTYPWDSLNAIPSESESAKHWNDKFLKT